MPFGDKWRKEPASYWDAMAKRCVDLPMNDRLRSEVLRSASVIEIGCGAGHFAESFFAAGFAGSYWGCDFSPAAAEAARTRLARGVVEIGQFEELSALGKVPSAGLAVARSVIQHQRHWLPLVQAALQHAPRILLGISRSIYFKESGEHEVQDRGNFYDVCISLDSIAREARDAGLACEFDRFDGPRGPEVVIGLSRLD